MTTDLVPTTPFDPLRYHEELLLLRKYIAELSYIDRVLALHYINDGDPRFLFDQDRPDVAYVDIGETYPFKRSRHGIWEGIWPGQVEEDLRAANEEATAWAASNIETLAYLTAPILHPQLEIYDAIDGTLETVENTLDQEVTRPFNELERTISRWDGDAAKAFANGFYFPFRDQILSNQENYVSWIRQAFQTSKAIARIAQHSLMTIVVATKEAVLEQLRQRAENTQKPSVKNLLIIAAGATAIVAAVGFAAPVTFTLTTITVGLGYAAHHVPEEAADIHTVAGASTDDLFNGLYDGVRDIGNNARAQYEGLHDELRELSAQFHDVRLAGGLLPPRPAIADGVEPDEFYHLTSSRYQE